MRGEADGRPHVDAVSGRLASALSGLLGTSTLVYRASTAADRWGIEFLATAGNGGWGPSFRADLESFMQARREPWGYFDPLRPQADQQNTVVCHGSDEVQATPVAGLHRAHGMVGMSEMRMLVCDGPMLLAWVGGYKESFDAQDAWMIRRFGLLTRRTLRLARMLPSGIPWQGIEAVLDALETDAFIVRADGCIELANRVGARRLAADGRAVGRDITASLARSSDERPFDIHPFGPARSDSRRLFLLTRSSSPAAVLDARVASARERWKLTPRQTMVVRLLAVGDGNKDIATKLCLALGSVERHVTQILRKARVESRLELVSRLWMTR